MFKDNDLQNAIATSSTLETKSLIVSEINMNSADRISVVGNYRYRPLEATYTSLPTAFVKEDELTDSPKYFGATDSAVEATDLQEEKTLFAGLQTLKKSLYSLDQCFQKFRPRSGINKAMYFGADSPNHYLHYSTSNMMSRPRYYMPSREDTFKYWTSFREENGIKRGISTKSTARTIDDVAPFVVYNQSVPTNRIIVKIQTHSGDVDNGPFIKNANGETFSDPFYNNKNIPTIWKLEYLDKDNNWQTLKTFTESDNVFGNDGYLELHYSVTSGTASWIVGSAETSDATKFVTDFVSPTLLSGQTEKYEQFQYIKGLRLSVTKMSKSDIPFELIELSPRLAVDFSDIVKDFTLSKVMSDLAFGGLPVGQLLASTGSITFADFEQALNLNNTKSIFNYEVDYGNNVIKKSSYIDKNVQLKFYEYGIVPDTYIPLKTMYAESFPQINSDQRIVSINLRDLYFYLESLTAPQLLMENVSFSSAIATLLDSIGFTNYIYKKLDSESDIIIPHFIVAPDRSVAEILNDLAVSTQTAIFFDEYNNLVFMSKGYILPDKDKRPVDTILHGSNDAIKMKELINSSDYTKSIANIKQIATQDNKIFNGGMIRYSTKYIQKSYQSTKEANLIDKDKTWVYKPVLLWEIAGEENVRSANEEKQNQSAYTLAAVPLESNLSNALPEVDSSGSIINNVLNLGDGVYWLSRYNGYLYSNGEILKYDAIEYSVGKQVTVANGLTGLISDQSNSLSLTGESIYFKFSNNSDLEVGQKIIPIPNQSFALDSKIIFGNTAVNSNVITLEKSFDTSELIVGQNVSKSLASTKSFDGLTVSGTNTIKFNSNSVKDVRLGETLTVSNPATPQKYTATVAVSTTGIANVTVLGTPLPDLTSIATSGASVYITSSSDPSNNTQDILFGTVKTAPKSSAKNFFVLNGTFTSANAGTKTISFAPRYSNVGANTTITYINEKDNYVNVVSNHTYVSNLNNRLYGAANLANTPGNLWTSGLVTPNISSIIDTTTFTVNQKSTTSGPIYINVAATANGIANVSNGGPLISAVSEYHTPNGTSKNSDFTITLSNKAEQSGGIKFDVVSPTGTVWISSVEEYQKYFGQIPFGGKMYPTGRVRIYSEPYFDKNSNRVVGPVARHGRAQFGTTVQNHYAGLVSDGSMDDWVSDSKIGGAWINSPKLFNQSYYTSSQVFSLVKNNNGDYSNPDLNAVFVSPTTYSTIRKATNKGIGSTVILASDPDGTSNVIATGSKITGFSYNQNQDFYRVILSKKPKSIKSSQEIIVMSDPQLVDGTLDYKVISNGISTTVSATYPAAVQTNPFGTSTPDAFAKETTRNGIIRNFMANSFISDSMVTKLKTTQVGTMQSSALVMQGRSFTDKTLARDFMSITKNQIGIKDPKAIITGNVAAPTIAPTHIGTRMRIIGKVNNDSQNSQSPSGAMTYFNPPQGNSEDPITIDGGSGGLGFFLSSNVSSANSSTHGVGNRVSSGYFYEIVALTSTSFDQYGSDALDQLANIVFYKIDGLDTTTTNLTSYYSKAKTSVLWRGLAPILVDDGLFTGQYRLTGEENPTVYDLAVEFEKSTQKNQQGVVTEDGIKFYLYLNNKLVGTVVDTTPLPDATASLSSYYGKVNTGLFVRGSSRVMFEKIYAMTTNNEHGTVNTSDAPLTGFNEFYNENQDIYNRNTIGKSEEQFLNGISPIKNTTSSLFYLNEFGSIMRECAYFNIRYDKAYPALSATIVPTFNKLQGYRVSGFTSNAYGAEFMVFNVTDAPLVLDAENGNYLKILGVTFTQQSEHQFTVDNYFNVRGDTSESDFNGGDIIAAKQKYQKIKNSRITYGKNDFSLESSYIQTQDAASDVMGWIVSKIMQPRKSVGVEIYADPSLQLGDIVQIMYKSDDVDQVVNEDQRFIIYNIEYSKSVNGPNMTIYLSEVPD